MDGAVRVDDGAGAVAVGDDDGAGTAGGVELAVAVGAAGVDGGAAGRLDDAAERAGGGEGRAAAAAVAPGAMAAAGRAGRCRAGWSCRARAGLAVGGQAGLRRRGRSVGGKPRWFSRVGLLGCRRGSGRGLCGAGPDVAGLGLERLRSGSWPRTRRTFSLSVMGMLGLAPARLKAWSRKSPKPVQPDEAEEQDERGRYAACGKCAPEAGDGCGRDCACAERIAQAPRAPVTCAGARRSGRSRGGGRP